MACKKDMAMAHHALFSQSSDSRRWSLSFFTSISAKQCLKSFSIVILLTAFVLIGTLPGYCKEPAKNPVRKMTVADAVFVALTNNVSLRNTYLDRYIQRITLRESERKYYLPSDPSLTLSVNRGSNFTAPNTANSVRTDYMGGTGTFNAQLAIPTGGTFDFVWDNAGDRPDLDQGTNIYRSNWALTFTQPLLKGGGLDNAAKAVRDARIDEEINILNLKYEIASTISDTIVKFRSYKDAERSLIIAEMSLVRSKALYEYNKDMIEAGRLAGTEIVQAQADIASQESSVISAKNSLDSARLALVQALYIDKNTKFEAVDENQELISPPPLEEALALAFQYRTSYLSALQNLEKTKLALSVAKRNMLWQLNLKAGTTDGASGATFDSYDAAVRRAYRTVDQRNWYIGLDLTIPLVFYMTSEIKAYLQAKNQLEKENLNLEKLKLDMEIEVQNALRNVDSSYRSMKSATLSRELSEKKLQIEKEKLAAGRTTNFQFVSFQGDLTRAQNAEVLARTAYLNSLTNLDITLGTTLATWNIDVRKEDDQFKQTSVKNETNPSKP